MQGNSHMAGLTKPELLKYVLIKRNAIFVNSLFPKREPQVYKLLKFFVVRTSRMFSPLFRWFKIYLRHRPKTCN